MPNPIIPVRVIDGLTTTDETGKTVEVEPVRAVDGAVDVDEVGRAIDVPEAVETAGLITTDEVGKAVPVQPVRVVDTATALNSAGRYVFARPMRGSIGSTPAVDLSDNFSADFTGVTDNTTLRTVTGWLDYNSTSSTDAKRNRLIVVGNQVQMDGAIGGGGVDFLVAHELDTRGLEGVYARFTIGTGWAGTPMTFAIGSTDEANDHYIQIQSTSIINLLKRVAGGTRTTVAGAVGRTFAVGDVIEIWLTKGLLVYVSRNGVREPSFNGVDLNSVGGGTAVMGRRTGFLTDANFASSGTRADNVYISSMNGFVTVTNDALFYPSDFNNLGASASDYTGHDVPVSGTYSTTGLTPTAMQVRVVDELNSATQYQGWTDVTGFTASAGTWSGTARILPTTNTGRLQVRFKNDSSITNHATTTIAVGPALLGYGQSNAAFALQGTSADTAVDTYRTRNTYSYDRPLSSTSANIWKRNDNGFVSQVLARKLYDAFGFTAGVCGGGIGSQPAEALRKTSPTATFADPYNGGVLTAPYQLLANHIAAARATGRVMAIYYDQGEAEGAISGSNVNMTNYTTDVTSIFADIRADFAGDRNVLGLMTLTGRNTSAPGANNNTNWSAVRATQKTMTSSIPNCVIGHTNIGVAMVDSLHYAAGVQGKTEKHRRIGQSVIFSLLGTGYKGSGPQTLTGTRSAAVITMPITANGATSYSALSGVDGTTAGSASALTSWEVSNDDFATTLTITSVTLTGTNVIITLAADPGGPVKVRNHWGQNPTITSWVFGTYSDGSKIALEPLVVPITVA